MCFDPVLVDFHSERARTSRKHAWALKREDAHDLGSSLNLLV